MNPVSSISYQIPSSLFNGIILYEVPGKLGLMGRTLIRNTMTRNNYIIFIWSFHSLSYNTMERKIIVTTCERAFSGTDRIMNYKCFAL